MGPIAGLILKELAKAAAKGAVAGGLVGAFAVGVSGLIKSASGKGEDIISTPEAIKRFNEVHGSVPKKKKRDFDEEDYYG